ncbi:IpaD/SipD/SspD family type III secretion system needle tip protein [Martelella alba]|uniref:IpaD/SipD/SspD family type III secretion system needle tip protein n=1 Tax=Martelella alba TaxID=2590451 RepID=A0ABY2SIL4_9HYPH|nr:IpaD/SipD/SspD family type III secretion system needle tip protein [Martelella alba]TKI05073.1 IpaD/SipD/SspD family type III secretion system needle tip protein [Martelella alba]
MSYVSFFSPDIGHFPLPALGDALASPGKGSPDACRNDDHPGLSSPAHDARRADNATSSYAGAHREWARCRECLADDKRALDSHLSALARRVDKATRSLEAVVNASASDNADTMAPAFRSTQDFGFNQEWQLSYQAATDNLRSALAGDALAAGAEQRLSRNAETGDARDSSAAAVADDPAFKSYAELWQDAVDAIGAIKEDYLEVYETVVERYTAFYSDFSDFMSGLTAYLDVSTDDKGNQTMQFRPEVLDEIDKLLATYGNGEQGVLFPATGSATREDAEKWAAELGLDPACVQASGDGYVVRIDLSPLQTIRDNMSDSALAPMSTFQYQSWRSGFDAQSGKFQTTLQLLTTKYGNANGMFDTMVKVLSSSITSGAETLKQILASI